MADFDVKDIRRRMNGAVEVLRQEFSGLRTGRASPGLLDPVMVEAYGSPMPMNQVATVSAPEPRLLTVNVWDKGVVKAVEKAIRESDLGLNPQTEGQMLRVPIPELTEERRIELGKVAHKYAEQARIAVRNVRRDAMDHLKAMERDGGMSQDEHHAWSDDVQKLTDEFIAMIDETSSTKEAEIMQV